MGDHKGGETTKKHPHQQQQQLQQQQQRQLSTSPESTDTIHDQQQQQQQPSVVVVASGGGGGASPFISASPLYVAIEQHQQQPQQFETVKPKRARYSGTSSSTIATSTPQWKLLPSPTAQQQQQKQAQVYATTTIVTKESTSSLSPPQQQTAMTTNPPTQTQQLMITTTAIATVAAASSSDTVSSPPLAQQPQVQQHDSPIPSLSPTSQQETSKEQPPPHHQFRKGKYVSPVWKPYEMLCLARAWRVQYQGGESISPATSGGGGDVMRMQLPSKGKTRAEKDREVAEFLNRNGVNRDAKTAGTKWDNMLGEFRKVYEWERGSERDQVGKSYFRLSPFERKHYRLPASFDEQVFDELSQFMGTRIRHITSSSTTRGPNPLVCSSSPSPSPPIGSSSSCFDASLSGSRPLLPHHLPAPTFKEDDLSLSDQYFIENNAAARSRQGIAMGSGGGGEHHQGGYLHGGIASLRGASSLLGSQEMMTATTSAIDVVGSGVGTSTTLSSRELRRIGKVRMIWEESVSLWADQEGEINRGRIRVQGSSFLNADEITFLDDSMVACTMEAFEDGPLKGFSVDKFICGQQLKVFGRRKSSSSPTSVSSGFIERVQLPLTEPSIIRSTLDFQDPTEFYVGCLRVPPTTLPTLFELSWYVQEPPPDELRFPLRKDVFRDLPQGKELFFTTTTELLDSRSIAFDLLGPIMRANPSLTAATASCRDAYIGIWDDCVNRVVSKFCSVEIVMHRKPSVSSSPPDLLQDQWPNVTGFLRSFCLWRGEETDQVREGQIEPSYAIAEKVLWTYSDLPYILGYYAVGYLVTFCALCRSQDRIVRTDLYTLNLSLPMDRLKALVPCYRIAGLLPLLAERCLSNASNNGIQKQLTFSDFERVELGNGEVIEMTPNMTVRYLTSRRKWAALKEIHDYFDHRIPHAEFIYHSIDKDLALVFKPRGVKLKPVNCDQLVEALKCVTKALVALHDLGFMHRDLSWDKVMVRDNEWFVCGFEEAAGAPQLHSHAPPPAAARGRYAPEMGRGLHAVKVDVWGVGYLLKTCGLCSSSNNIISDVTINRCNSNNSNDGVVKMLRELQNRCLDPKPEQRPTAADCYHHLLQVQSSLQQSASSSGGGGGGGDAGETGPY